MRIAFSRRGTYAVILRSDQFPIALNEDVKSLFPQELKDVLLQKEVGVGEEEFDALNNQPTSWE